MLYYLLVIAMLIVITSIAYTIYLNVRYYKIKEINSIKSYERIWIVKKSKWKDYKRNDSDEIYYKLIDKGRVVSHFKDLGVTFYRINRLKRNN